MKLGADVYTCQLVDSDFEKLEWLRSSVEWVDSSALALPNAVTEHRSAHLTKEQHSLAIKITLTRTKNT